MCYFTAMDEQWQPAPGFHGHYEVSNLGHVRSLMLRPGRCKKSIPRSVPLALKPQKWKKGYRKYRFGKCDGLNPNSNNSAFFAHRLVWETFRGPVPDGLTINHIDGDKTNNRLDNLELATHQEQDTHARSLGTKRWRTKDGFTEVRLTADDIREIRRAYATGKVTQVSLARKYRVGPSNIRWILSRRTWKHI